MKLGSLLMVSTVALAGLAVSPLAAEDATAPAVAAAAAVTPPATAADAPAAPAAEPQAATPVVASTAPAPSCELHVFPTLEGQAMTSGMLSGFGIIGAVADAAANKNRNISDANYLKEALGPRFQVDALKSLDLVTLLKLPPSQVIFETPIADRKITTKANTRLSNSNAECYAELIVTENFYQKAAIYGRSLSNRFVFKDFRGGKTTATLVKGRGGNGLTRFPPKDTSENEAAEQDLRRAFAANFTEFVKNIGAQSAAR